MSTHRGRASRPIDEIGDDGIRWLPSLTVSKVVGCSVSLITRARQSGEIENYNEELNLYDLDECLMKLTGKKARDLSAIPPNFRRAAETAAIDGAAADVKNAAPADISNALKMLGVDPSIAAQLVGARPVVEAFSKLVVAQQKHYELMKSAGGMADLSAVETVFDRAFSRIKEVITAMPDKHLGVLVGAGVDERAARTALTAIRDAVMLELATVAGDFAEIVDDLHNAGGGDDDTEGA